MILLDLIACVVRNDDVASLQEPLLKVAQLELYRLGNRRDVGTAHLQNTQGHRLPRRFSAEGYARVGRGLFDTVGNFRDVAQVHDLAADIENGHGADVGDGIEVAAERDGV